MGWGEAGSNHQTYGGVGAVGGRGGGGEGEGWNSAVPKR